MNQGEKKRILVMLGVMTALMLSLVVYLTVFQIKDGEEVQKSAYNQRSSLAEEKTLRGSIYSSEGQLLAYTDEETRNRIYPFGSLFAPVIGYHSKVYGNAGLELSENDLLLNRYESDTITALRNYIYGINEGNQLYLTLSKGVQEKAQALLGNRKGAVVAMKPQTGEILCMVSYPSFDPNHLEDAWESLVNSEDSPLINRCTQGLYEPGSTFKILSAMVQLQELNNREEVFHCTGTKEIGGYTFKDYSPSGHGSVDLDGAFAKSCNTYFAAMSERLKKSDYVNMAEKFYFNQKIPLEVPVDQGRMKAEEIKDKTALASSAIGQGNVLATPMNMLLMTSAIANDGKLMAPYVVAQVMDPVGKTKLTEPRVLGEPISPEVAGTMKELMRKVVIQGTGTSAGINGWEVSGKTGTAENASGLSHDWFVGFAPYEHPQVAVAVVLEKSGQGGGVAAAPIAGQLIKYIYENQ